MQGSATAGASIPKHADNLMNAGGYAEYVRRFNARDERYADFYAPGVVFEHGPVFGNLHGSEAILDFYRTFWKSFDETLVPGQIIIDKSKGLMAVELTTHLVARVDGAMSQSRPQGMNRGDEIISVATVLYELKNGKVRRIRAAPDQTTFEPVTARTAPAPFPGEVNLSNRSQVEQAYRHYVECFNRQDDRCFTRYYDNGVVFLSGSLPEMHGSNEIVDFYRNAWRHFHEHLIIRGVEVSPDKIVANLENTLEVSSDFPDFTPRALKQGERLHLRGKVVYELRKGRFTLINDGAR